MPALDISAAEVLTALQQELHRRQIQLRIARDLGQVRDVLDHSDAANLSGILGTTVRAGIQSIDDGDAQTNAGE